LIDAGFGTANAHSYGTYTANSATLVDNLYDVQQDTQKIQLNQQVVGFSNWKRLSYTASTSEPANEPTNGTLWYNTNLEADIMVHNGTTWEGYVQCLRHPQIQTVLNSQQPNLPHNQMVRLSLPMTYGLTPAI
jgi:hypothetical protein